MFVLTQHKEGEVLLEKKKRIKNKNALQPLFIKAKRTFKMVGDDHLRSPSL